jgi:hypothetical protein
LAIASLNKDPVVSHSAELVSTIFNLSIVVCVSCRVWFVEPLGLSMFDFPKQLRIGKMPKASEIRKGVDPLDIPLTI